MLSPLIEAKDEESSDDANSIDEEFRNIEEKIEQELKENKME